MLPIRALIFDRDGVLTYFDNEEAKAFFEPLLSISLEDLSSRWLVLERERGAPSSVAAEKEFFREFWDRLSDEFDLSSRQRQELHRFDYTSLLRPFPEVREALEDARSRGLRIGVLSNFALASLEASLRAVGLGDLVDVACAATVIGAPKPDAAAYRAATEALAIAPRECIFFDDEIPMVEGARAFGMRAYWVDRNRSGHAISEGIVRDLACLPEILGRRPGASANGRL